jgi:chromosome partitioning protein
MGRVIAIANQKGGVGKTTTAVNLAAALSATRRSVLLVDMDAQGNATMGVGVNKSALVKSGCDVLLGEADAAAAIVNLEMHQFALLPANADLTAAEVGLRGRKNGELALRNALAPLRERYAYILIDCPPALSMLTVNALAACDGVLIPMQCEYYALEGLSALIDTTDKVRAVINPQLRIEGILRTMYDPRNNLSGQVSAQLITHFGDQVYRTIIPRNVRLAEAPSHGLPALSYDPMSSGSEAYVALAGELLRRTEKRAA